MWFFLAVLAYNLSRPRLSTPWTFSADATDSWQHKNAVSGKRSHFKPASSGRPLHHRAAHSS